jgi:RpiB/LacA/LacB family sugar-phosphate isomerase
MRIAIASDHAGYDLKSRLLGPLKEWGHDCVDLGTGSTVPVDYPVFAETIALRIQSGASERGILICGSGVGASIAANKFRGIRAGLCHDCYSAHQGVEHDHMNILVLGSRVIAAELAKDLVKDFLAALPSQEARHLKRLHEIEQIEERWSSAISRKVS